MKLEDLKVNCQCVIDLTNLMLMRTSLSLNGYLSCCIYDELDAVICQQLPQIEWFEINEAKN